MSKKLNVTPPLLLVMAALEAERLTQEVIGHAARHSALATQYSRQQTRADLDGDVAEVTRNRTQAIDALQTSDLCNNVARTINQAPVMALPVIVGSIHKVIGTSVVVNFGGPVIFKVGDQALVDIKDKDGLTALVTVSDLEPLPEPQVQAHLVTCDVISVIDFQSKAEVKSTLSGIGGTPAPETKGDTAETEQKAAEKPAATPAKRKPAARKPAAGKTEKPDTHANTEPKTKPQRRGTTKPQVDPTKMSASDRRRHKSEESAKSEAGAGQSSTQHSDPGAAE